MESIKIKTDWKEITLRDVIKIGGVDLDKELENRPLAKKFKHLEAVSNFSLKEILKLRGKPLDDSLAAIEYLLTQPKKYNPKTFKLKTEIEDYKHLAGEYMFYKDLTKLSAGEMLSIEVLIKNAHDNNTHVWPGILAVLVRPIEIQEKNGKEIKVIQEFEADDIEDRTEFFMDSLMAPHFYHQVNFFLASVMNSKNTTK